MVQADVTLIRHLGAICGVAHVAGSLRSTGSTPQAPARSRLAPGTDLVARKARGDQQTGGPRIIVLVGPTGSGKSALALRLAARLPLEIVNCDASQFYVGMDVGTAKPTREERALVPHHLYDVCRPDEPMNAGRFVALAGPVVQEIRSRGRFPLFVGGTGLYVRALTEGLAPIPAVPDAVHREVLDRLRDEGLPALRAELERVDPIAASRIAANDPQRTTRALAVRLATGRTLSSFHEGGYRGSPYESLKLGLQLEPALLRARLRARVQTMFDAGFPEEVARLLATGVDENLRTFKALGYREVAAMLRGEISRADAMERVARQHLRYVKRQRTWFAREPGIRWFAPDQEEEMAELAASFCAEV